MEVEGKDYITSLGKKTDPVDSVEMLNSENPESSKVTMNLENNRSLEWTKVRCKDYTHLPNCEISENPEWVKVEHKDYSHPPGSQNSRPPDWVKVKFKSYTDSPSDWVKLKCKNYEDIQGKEQQN